ncbi:MAG: dimethylarginine dimethylaminohydrolase family protein [Promethearchaeota archaeon]
MQQTIKFGGQSMIKPLKKIFLKSPKDQPAEAKLWKDFGYFHKPDLTQGIREHEQLVDLLRGEGVEVILAKDDEKGSNTLLDSIFVFDNAIMTNLGAILCKMGKKLREAEVPIIERELQRIGIPIYFKIHGDARLEGGDVLWLDPQTVIVGKTHRTNELGFLQLKMALEELSIEVYQFPLPYWKGPEDLIHLLSIIHPLDKYLAVAYLELMPLNMYEFLSNDRGIELIELTHEELRAHGNNVLMLKPRKGIMVKGNKSKRKLEEFGVEILEFEGEDICHNRSGGPTCLSLPLLRE